MRLHRICNEIIDAIQIENRIAGGDYAVYLDREKNDIMNTSEGQYFSSLDTLLTQLNRVQSEYDDCLTDLIIYMIAGEIRFKEFNTLFAKHTAERNEKQPIIRIICDAIRGE